MPSGLPDLQLRLPDLRMRLPVMPGPQLMLPLLLLRVHNDTCKNEGTNRWS